MGPDTDANADLAFNIQTDRQIKDERQDSMSGELERQCCQDL